jgi:hypothetical protein
VYYLEKTGALTPGMRLLGGLGSMALLAADRKHQDELMREAAIMNRMMREAEADRMEGVASGFAGLNVIPRAAMATSARGAIMEPDYPMGTEMERRASVELDPELAKLAEGIGQGLAARAADEAQYAELMEKMASGELTELEKQAVLSLLRRGAGAVTKAVRGAGSRIAGAVKSPKLKMPKGPTTAAAPKPAVPGGAYRTPVKPATTPPKVTPGATQQGFTTGKPGAASPWAAEGAESLQAKARQAPVRKTSGPTGPAELAGPQTAAQRNIAKGSEEMLEAGAKYTPPTPAKKKWISTGTKAKIGLGLVGAGVAYGGYKGLQSARDYMGKPIQGGQRYGKYGPQVAHQVSQYGYVPSRY